MVGLPDSKGSYRLSEVRYLLKGERHGFEWWLNEDGTVFEESHHVHGQAHGIERQWNDRKRLRKGFPRYWVKGVRVDKRQYLRACEGDSTLPRVRAADQRPRRTFPKEIARALRVKGQSPSRGKGK